MACQEGHQEVVLLLLADMRTEPNLQHSDQCTPLWIASQNGHLIVVQLVLVSEREITTTPKSIAGAAPWNGKTAAEMARFHATRLKDEGESEQDYTRMKQNGPLIADLLDSFDLDPATTRQRLRELPLFRDPFIGELFAVVVFLCDDLLAVDTESSSSTTSNMVARFFQIAQCLPMELQMVLCNRCYGAGKNMVLTKHSEPAFKKLGKLFSGSGDH